MEKEPFPNGAVIVEPVIFGAPEGCPICGLLLTERHLHQLPTKAEGWQPEGESVVNAPQKE